MRERRIPLREGSALTGVGGGMHGVRREAVIICSPSNDV